MGNKEMITLLSCLLAITVVFFIVTYVLLAKKIKKNNEYAIFISDTKIKIDFLYLLYKYFSQNFFTKRSVKKIKTKFDLSYPGDEKRAALESMRVLLKIWISSIFVGLFVLMNNVDVYGTILIFMMIYIIQNEVVTRFVERQEIKLLSSLSKYINELRKYYFTYGMIETAIYEANETAQEEMKLHGKQIYEILTSSDRDEEILLYNEQVPNRFLKILLAICSTTMEFGDKKLPNDETVFLFNLKELGREIIIEKLKREKKANVYMGTTWLTILPIFSIPLIKSWAIWNIEKLYTWYHGVFGILTLGFLFLLTILVYQVLTMMKESFHIDKDDHVILESIAQIPIVSDVLEHIVQKNYGKTLRTQDLLKHSGNTITVKEFYIKRILTSIAYLIIGFSFLVIIHSSVKNLQINYVDNVTGLTSATTQKEEHELKGLVKKFTNEYKNEKKITSKKNEITRKMKAKSSIKNEYVLSLISDEVIERVKIYQKQHLKLYEFIFVLVFAIIGYMMPKWLILLKEKFLQMEMEDEVIELQTIIIMLMYFDRVSVKIILTWMEHFSVLFKESIQVCLSNFSSGEEEALEALIEEEPFAPFVRIIENLQHADRVGIRKAFNEILVDRQNYQEKRKQENEISLKNRGSIASVIAMIPLSATILFYLAYPFISYSLQSLQNFTNDIKFM